MTKMASNGRQYFLRSAHIDAFGGVINRDYGPFVPGLNVVYGANEAGKTTLSAFVEGVLFGWEESRGKKNSYRPPAGERAGSLVFESCDSSLERVSLARAKNPQGLQCSGDNDILSDIDRQTFKSVFRLSGLDLHSMEDPEAAIAGLLTASSGSAVPPSQVADQIDKRLSRCVSKAASCPDSIPNIMRDLQDCGDRLAQAKRQMNELGDARVRLAQAEEKLVELENQLEEANDEIDELSLRCAQDRSRYAHARDSESLEDKHSKKKPFLLPTISFGFVGAVLLVFSAFLSSLPLAAIAALTLLCAAILGVVMVARGQKLSTAASRAQSDSHGKGNLGNQLDLGNRASSDEVQLRELIRVRGVLQRSIASTSELCGQLRQQIAMGDCSDGLDSLRMRERELSLRLKKSKDEYATLLIAREMLEDAMRDWEYGGQDRVLEKAGDLFALMTDGSWVQIRLGQKGDLVAVSDRGQMLHPAQLSLGTRQQLYLALRLALLMTADDAGRSIPVIADDILVNFDDKRRKGAIRALAELSKKRQIVLFTCHLDVVGLIQEAYANVNILQL